MTRKKTAGAAENVQAVRSSARLKNASSAGKTTEIVTAPTAGSAKRNNTSIVDPQKPRNAKRRKINQDEPPKAEVEHTELEEQSSIPKKKATKKSPTNRVNGTNKSAKPDVKAAKDSSESAYWLMKAEPESRVEKGIDVKFSIDDLQACTEPEPWSGVRNGQAKNHMLAMKKGELALFYHSNCKLPGIAGVMEIVHESSPDITATDAKHPYFDEKSDPANPRWFNVHVGFKQTLPRYVSLKELQKYKGAGQPLEHMQLHRQSRLSVSKVSKSEWDFIMNLAETSPDEEKSKS